MARVLLVLCIVTLLTLPNLNSFISRNYMTVSNAFLMPIGILFYSIYRKGHWWDYLLILAGLLIVLIYGSRGGFLMLSFLAVTILYIKMQKKKVLFLLFIVLFVLVGAVLIVQSDILSQSTSRTLQKILNGELFDSSGRFEIWEYLLSRSLSNGFIGRGLCADRMYLIELYNTNEQVYAHNFLVKLLTDFGLLGFIAGIALIVVLIGFLRRCGEPLEKIAVVIFVFTSFLQLMFSRTFLSEPGFFIMMGIVLRWRVFFKNKKGEHRYEKVSVIIPTYKSNETLRRAIDSVLAQTYENIEVVVTDDNNPDT